MNIFTPVCRNSPRRVELNKQEVSSPRFYWKNSKTKDLVFGANIHKNLESKCIINNLSGILLYMYLSLIQINV